MAVKALGELENIWQMPEPYKHLNRITPLIEQVQNVNHQLVEQHRQHALERIDARIEESRQRLQEAHATSELQNSVLLPMQKPENVPRSASQFRKFWRNSKKQWHCKRMPRRRLTSGSTSCVKAGSPVTSSE